jgi:RNA-binding protein YlmH
MEKDQSLTKKRFFELCERAEKSSRFTFTGFLNMEEQSLLLSMKKELPLPFTLFGGMEDCERRVARFGSEDAFGYAEPFPIACVGISAVAARFGAELSHRDVLGSILGLGVERSILGDIAVKGESAFAFCLASMAGYVAENLTRVGRQGVKCALLEHPPEGPLYSLSEQKIQISSERIDAVVAKAYNLSREDSAELFLKEKVYIDAALCKNSSRTLKEGEIVSVRGFGRFVYRGTTGTTKKGRLNAIIEKYG